MLTVTDQLDQLNAESADSGSAPPDVTQPRVKATPTSYRAITLSVPSRIAAAVRFAPHSRSWSARAMRSPGIAERYVSDRMLAAVRGAAGVGSFAGKPIDRAFPGVARAAQEVSDHF